MLALACPFASWNDLTVVDPSQHTTATMRHYKWRRSAPSLCTPSTPLLSLSLPHRSISPDLAGAAPIASSHPPELADHRHRLEQPRASPRYQELLRLANVASNLAIDLRRPTAPSDPLGEYDQEKMVIFDIKLMVGFGCDTIPILKVPPQYPKWMEPYVQTETYDLENGGSLVFERDLYLVHTAGWTVLLTPFRRDLLGCVDRTSPHSGEAASPTSRGTTPWGTHGTLFAPGAQVHVQHLDFMLHETRKDLELTRVHSHRAQMALTHHADAIRLLAKDRRSLRLQRAKNVATITRLREKIRTLEVTVRTQQDQIQEMEEDGEDIQGGDDFLSDDNDFEDDEFTDEEDYEFLEAAEDGIIPIDVDEDNEE
ncbi:hypothetical protein QYE76_066862 [Lolium multiflorum]|uniref:Uncharacterized protein n=1 Tax=Lolium multiflorum TaxID=4521 RepID=A0AAD8SBG9_LOLMU|nr:hypothetical protein QYE76_066862 [Lolium multiflorum]